jgi:signal transduction histidine kinase
MTDSDSHQTEQKAKTDVAFFGRITASVTHELNNVISIVDQNAGLLDDLIVGEERGVPLSLERLESVSKAIQNQTQRGLQIIERLNKFAHSTDFSEAECDVNQTIGNLVELSQRLASLKRMEIIFAPAQVTVQVSGSGLVLQRVVFAALELALSNGTAGTTISVMVKPEDQGAVVLIEFSADSGVQKDHEAEARSAVEQIGGRLEVGSSEDGVKVRVYLPRALTG